MTTSIIRYDIGVNKQITTTEPLPPQPVVPAGAIVVIEGRAPIWRYGMALHLLQGSSASVIAFHDHQLGDVIVASHHPDYQAGQLLVIPGSAG